MSKKKITSFVETLSIGATQRCKNLDLFPLTSTISRDGYEYVLLDEAIKQNLIEVQEKGEAGSVPEILVKNRSDKRVLMLDGEELVGAKQNRILNTTIIIAAHSETIVPVSCTEAGRWHYRSAKFSASPTPSYARLRRAKSRDVLAALESTGRFEANQSRVWDEISERAALMRVKSPTRAMRDVYKSHEDRVKKYVDALDPVDNQIGVLFAINGEAIGADVFDKPYTLQKLHERLVSSYTLDAIAEYKPKTRRAPKREAEEFLRKLGESRFRKFKSVGEGNDYRIEGPDLIGSSLTVEDRIVHLALFKKLDEGGRSRISSPSRRARLR